MSNDALYRAQLSCQIGKDALDGTDRLPRGMQVSQYALYNLLCAVEGIVEHLQANQSPEPERGGD